MAGMTVALRAEEVRAMVAEVAVALATVVPTVAVMKAEESAALARAVAERAEVRAREDLDAAVVVVAAE